MSNAAKRNFEKLTNTYLFTAEEATSIKQKSLAKTYLGTWNAATKPPLKENPEEGDYYGVVGTGKASVTGTEETFTGGDILVSNGTAWFREPFSNYGLTPTNGSVTLQSLELRLNSLMAFLLTSIEENPNGDTVWADKQGYIAMMLTALGVLKSLEINVKKGVTAENFNGVQFSSNDDFIQLLLDPLEYIAYYLDKQGRLGALEVKTKLLKLGDSIGLKANAEGSFQIVNLLTNEVIFQVSSQGEAEVRELRLKMDSIDQLLITLADAAGNIGNGLDGNMQLLSGGSSSASTTTKAQSGFHADIVHIVMYGQSLSRGANAIPALSTQQRKNSLCFTVGPATWTNQSADPETVYPGLIPLVEKNQETPCSGIADMVLQLIEQENGLAYNQHQYQLLLSAPGQGNQTIAQLSKGTTNYQHFLWDVEYGMKRANELGKTYNVPAVCWNQGEADATNANYAEALQKLQLDMNADVKRITGQTNDVKLIIYQTASFNAYSETIVGRPIVAYAQEEAVSKLKNVYMSAPMYHLTYDTDQVHLTNVSSRLNGAAHGLAFKRIVIDGLDWKLPTVKRITRQGKLLELTYDVWVKPLVLDDVTIANPGNYGFRLFKPGGVEMTLTSVFVVRPDAIRITASEAIPVGSLLTYAANGIYRYSGPQQGTRGCVRDSQNIVFDPQGTNQLMRNWSPIFNRTLS